MTSIIKQTTRSVLKWFWRKRVKMCREPPYQWHSILQWQFLFNQRTETYLPHVGNVHAIDIFKIDPLPPNIRPKPCICFYFLFRKNPAFGIKERFTHKLAGSVFTAYWEPHLVFGTVSSIIWNMCLLHCGPWICFSHRSQSVN